MNAQNYETLEELYNAMKDGLVEDWDNLSTFGGDEPEDTFGVWSWDADHLITGSHAGDLMLEER